MPILKQLMIMSLLVMMTACANVATGPMYSPANALKPGETGIYVYSKHSAYRYIGNTGPELYLDGKLIGPLPNHGYWYTRLAPGSHVVAVKYSSSVLMSRTNDLPFVVDKHQVKYFEARWQDSGQQVMMSSFVMVPKYEWRLHPVSEALGKHDVTQLPLAQ